MNLIKGLLCLFCMLPFSTVFAQQTAQETSLEKKATCSIYFNSDQYKLDIIAQQTLDDFINKYPTNDGFELRLRGFTDDIGAQVKNEALAQKRALAVQEYLNTLEITPKKLKILACEELQLDNSQNIAKQRKENRRVEVEYWGVASGEFISEAANMEELNAFFDNNRRAAQQQFLLEASNNNVITGAQGTVLRIPANCFVDSKGLAAKGQLTLVLQEVYSYKDMILQNLVTASNGRQLETGGMLYLEAKDALGNVLAIREGAAIDAVMASEASKLPEMQTFEGASPANASNNAVNWMPTGQLVSNRFRSNFGTGNQEGVNLGGTAYSSFVVDTFSNVRYMANFYQKSNFKELKEASDLYLSTQEMPRRELAKPTFRMRPIRYPNLKKIQKISREDLKVKYPKSAKENKASYNGRILSKYIKLKKVYRKRDLKNRKKVRTYKRDSSKYVAAYEKHEAAIFTYTAYEQEMRKVLSDLYKSTNGLDFKEQSSLFASITTLASSIRIRNQSIVGARTGLIQRLTSLDTIGEALLARVNAYDPILLTEKELELLNQPWEKRDISKLIRKFYRASSKSNLSSYKNQFAARANTIERLYERIQNKENLSAYDLSQIRKRRVEISKKYNYRLLETINTDLKQIIKEIEPILGKFLSAEDSILAYQQDYADLRAAYNLPLDDGQSGIEFMGTNERVILNIRNMGWINCDRFTGTPQNLLASVNIQTESTQNTSFYVIFKDINSVMPAYFVNETSFATYNVPKNSAVKIVGIKKKGEQFELFLKEGTIGELGLVTANFEKKTAEELNLVFANL